MSSFDTDAEDGNTVKLPKKKMTKSKKLQYGNGKTKYNMQGRICKVLNQVTIQGSKTTYGRELTSKTTVCKPNMQWRETEVFSYVHHGVLGKLGV